VKRESAIVNRECIPLAAAFGFGFSAYSLKLAAVFRFRLLAFCLKLAAVFAQTFVKTNPCPGCKWNGLIP